MVGRGEGRERGGEGNNKQLRMWGTSGATTQQGTEIQGIESRGVHFRLFQAQALNLKIKLEAAAC